MARNKPDHFRDGLAEIYLSGVELRRGRLSDQERKELLDAWKAGYSANDTEGKL